MPRGGFCLAEEEERGRAAAAVAAAAAVVAEPASDRVRLPFGSSSSQAAGVKATPQARPPPAPLLGHRQLPRGLGRQAGGAGRRGAAGWAMPWRPLLLFLVGIFLLGPARAPGTGACGVAVRAARG